MTSTPLPEQRGIELNRIYNEDCLETMKRIPDNFVDLVLTDPPYGIGVDKSMAKDSGTKRGKSAAQRSHYKSNGWDNTIPSHEVFNEIFRVSKHQVIFGGNYFSDYLPASPSWIVWDKDNGNNGYADCELIWTSHKSAIRLKRYKWHGMLQEDMKNKEKRYHPTQKPVPLMRWILSRYAKEGDLVYDPFIGSGTTARACVDLRFNYIGSEISKEYCDITEERLKQGVLL